MTYQLVIRRFGLAGALALTATACTAADDPSDPEVIADELDKENGGLTMDDEAPYFGDTELFDEAELSADELAFDDPMETSPEVIAMMDRSSTEVFDAVVTWGQIVGDPDATEPRDWSGRFELSRGALLVRRRLAAADGDRIDDRTDRRIVRFRAARRAGLDGLRLRLIDDAAGSDEPLRLRYIGDDGVERELDVRGLHDRATDERVDDRGNRIIATATRRPLDVCDHGFVNGRWHQVGPNHGVMVGRVHSADGDAIGHVRGIWGQRRDGEPVFFGKFIGRDGRFRGIYAGTYGEGELAGRWLIRSGDHGTLAGIYRDAPGPRLGGLWLARWHETSCNLDR